MSGRTEFGEDVRWRVRANERVGMRESEEEKEGRVMRGVEGGGRREGG